MILIFLNNLYCEDWNVICPTNQKNVNISGLSYAFSGEYENETNVYGELDTCNFYMPIWDSSSPVCGGTGHDNLYVELVGPCDVDSYSFPVGITTGYSIHQFNAETSEYENATIMVNGIPCMSKTETAMTLAFYDWNDEHNIGFVTATRLSIVNEIIHSLTEDEASELKSICESTDYTDYTPYLDKIINNTNSNSNIETKITNIDNRQVTLDNNLIESINSRTLDDFIDGTDDMTDFEETFEQTLIDTFDEYSDVFGFGGYGSAPAPITFSIIGKTYTIFDVSILGNNVDLIRNTFLLFAYLYGFIIVFRTT